MSGPTIHLKIEGVGTFTPPPTTDEAESAQEDN